MADIKHLLHVSAPREKVYEAITTIDGLSRWWTKDTKGDTGTGNNIEFRFGIPQVTKMKVIESKPFELVQWECVDGFDDWVGTSLSFQLDENDGKTRVRFSHSNWKDANDFFAGCSFSWGRYMESLRQLCQLGKGEAWGTEGYRK